MLKINKLKERADVYDIQVPITENFYANGILVHNCEIYQYTDERATAICTLSSMILKNFVVNGKFNFKLLAQEVRRVTRALNRVIDINSYTTKKGEKGGMEQRAIAIGVQGLADVFFLMDYAFASEEAKKLNKDIFETIYFAAISESCKLCEEGVHKPYKFFKGSPMSKGIFQFDMWEKREMMLDEETGKEKEVVNKVELSGMWDWEGLKESVMKYGVCNSLLSAQMPVACQTKETRIRLSNGEVKSFEEIMQERGIDAHSVEKMSLADMWIDFDYPVLVETMNGIKESNRIYYSGLKETFAIEMEDGTIFEASENHMFLVDSNGKREWKKVSELKEEDEIVNIFEQQTYEQDVFDYLHNE